MKNAGKACNNRLYRHIRTFEKIVKNYFVISAKKVMSITVRTKMAVGLLAAVSMAVRLSMCAYRSQIKD